MGVSHRSRLRGRPYALHGLNPDADYTLAGLDAGAIKRASGARLTAEGSAVVEYRRR